MTKDKLIHVKVTSDELRIYAHKCRAEHKTGGEKLRELVAQNKGIPSAIAPDNGLIRQIRIDDETLTLIHEKIPYNGRTLILGQIIRRWINQ